MTGAENIPRGTRAFLIDSLSDILRPLRPRQIQGGAHVII